MKNALKISASVILAASLAACGGGGSSTPTSTPASTSTPAPTALQIIDTQVGTGATVVAGNTISVNYTGWLYSATAANFEGAEFDSSIADGGPFSFTVGAGQVIAGFDQGVVGMKVGGTRTLIIPSSLAYGANTVGSIPANSALVFSVTLLSQ